MVELRGVTPTGNEITTEITVDDSLLNRMVELHSARKQAEAVLGEGLTEQSVLERIADALRRREDIDTDGQSSRQRTVPR
jgi:hypothetical protein